MRQEQQPELPQVLLTGEPARPRAHWRPVRAGGRVVDLVLTAVDPDERGELGLPLKAVGSTMTSLFPDAAVDGRLALFCDAAETGTPFRMTRPAAVTRRPVVLVVQRSGSEDVVVGVERGSPPGHPDDPARDQQRWQRLFDDTPLGVLVMTLDGYVLEANRAVCAMLRRPSAEVVGRRLTEFSAPEDHQRIDRERLLRTGHATMQKRYLRGDGTDLWLRVTASLVLEGGERRSLAVCEDVTSAQQALAELAHRAGHDDLTGLPNRAALRERLQRSLAGTAEGRVPGVGLLFLDLDRFKVINDSLGHAAGDRLLKAVAARLRATTPAADLLGRLSGDEFAVVTDEPGRAVALAGELVEALAAPFLLDGREVTVGGSIGIALQRTAGDGLSDEDALLRDADTAMYAAKRAGQGPVVLFEDTLRHRALARLEDEQGLRRALQRGELRVHYQPVVALPGLQPVGLEALVRWQHPDRGLLGPGAFLPTAEETGLVVPLGRHVLREACLHAARLRAAGQPLRVAVNIAAQHLAAGTLHEDVEQALSAAGLPPESLTLEITEQALVVSHVEAAAVLGDLRARGCRVALDDFGTGYSSLAYLRRLPVDVLKVDRTFVVGAGEPGHDSALLRAITALGASLGLDTVLEGIETEQELQAARDADATHVQGFLLGRPEPA